LKKSHPHIKMKEVKNKEKYKLILGEEAERKNEK
jgi:hypothetical protein